MDIVFSDGNIPPKWVIFYRIKHDGLENVILEQLKGHVKSESHQVFVDILDRIAKDGYDAADYLRLRHEHRSRPEKFMEVIIGTCCQCRENRLPVDRVVQLLHSLSE
ncbi:hypothetical protein LIER_06399 [Lithospermum erythrorhizon]|uniref:Uncharacterized protein n=1 Tax=Lithospermum erythrorhizon TaxID=34254 RepID=A0AAV3P5S1_LITER